MANTGELEADIVFLGLTRQPTLFGVTYNVVMLNFFVGMIYFVASTDLKSFLIMPLIHGAAFLVSSKEPLFLELFTTQKSKCSHCKNKMYHNMTNSYDVY